jgi:hypothetical protein
MSKARFKEYYREKEASIPETSIISFLDIVEEEEEGPSRRK